MPFYQKDKSRLKMVGLTGPREENITWYSPVWQNSKPVDEIMRGMLSRFRQKPYSTKCKIIQFYENNQLVQEIRL